MSCPPWHGSSSPLPPAPATEPAEETALARLLLALLTPGLTPGLPAGRLLPLLRRRLQVARRARGLPGRCSAGSRRCRRRGGRGLLDLRRRLDRIGRQHAGRGDAGAARPEKTIRAAGRRL